MTGITHAGTSSLDATFAAVLLLELIFWAGLSGLTCLEFEPVGVAALSRLEDRELRLVPVGNAPSKYLYSF